jgi:hypothetical protein
MMSCVAEASALKDVSMLTDEPLPPPELQPVSTSANPATTAPSVTARRPLIDLIIGFPISFDVFGLLPFKALDALKL